MDFRREELLPGVWLTAIGTDKFKTGTLSLSLLSQLDSSTAAMNAVIPSVLRCGTTLHPDMESLAVHMESLYGTIAEPVVRIIGEIQATGFYLSFPDGKYLPGQGKDMLNQACSLLGELLLSPNTRGGLLLRDYVNGERTKLVERIRAQKNNKDGWAVKRLIDGMCGFEPFAIGRLGSEDAADAIHYQKLTRHYRELISTAPIEIFYCGSAEFPRVCAALSEALLTLPRCEINYDIGTDVRMNSVEDEPRQFTEQLNVNQGKLSIGWRLGECMEDPDIAAIRVFNSVFGGGVTSKLFVNVRERLSLCYYASSAVDTHKGLMMVSSGIAFDKHEQTKNEIFAQLEAIKRGEVTQGELSDAKKSLSSDLRAMRDDPAQLEHYWLGSNLDGEGASPEELAAAAEGVTIGDVVAIANSVCCDAMYFMDGTGAAEDE